MKNMLSNCKITRILVDTAAGQAATASDILDMAGFESVMFIAKLGEVTSASVVTLTAQQNSANSTVGMATLVGSATKTASANDSDNGLLVLDVVKPDKRYIRAVLTSATQDAVKNGIIAIQYGASNVPVTQGSTVLDSDTLAEPAEA